jgi:hypothetical protein
MNYLLYSYVKISSVRHKKWVHQIPHYLSCNKLALTANIYIYYNIPAIITIVLQREHHRWLSHITHCYNTHSHIRTRKVLLYKCYIEIHWESPLNWTFSTIEKYIYRRGYGTRSERRSRCMGGWDTLEEGADRMSIYPYSMLSIARHGRISSKYFRV